MVSSVSTGAWDSCVGLAPLASGALPRQIQALTRVQVEVPSCLCGHGAARRGLRSLCCDTGCSVSVLGRVGFGLLVALEAWPKGLDHCPCQVTASYVPPHSTCPSVTCAPVGVGSCPDLCLQLEGAGPAVSPGGGTTFGGFQVFGQAQIPVSLLRYVLDQGLCYEEQCFI